MTDRFRYLPCALHPALSVPAWAKIDVVVLDVTGPFCLLPPSNNGRNLHIDLAHPAGWNHAVWAAASIIGTDNPVSESMSVGFCYDPLAYMDHEDSRQPMSWWRFVVDGHDDVLVRGVPESLTSARPEHRREALCRCICAALGVDVAHVFLVEET